MTTRLSTLIACGLTLTALTVTGCGDGYSSPAMPTPNSPGSSNVTITIVGEKGNQSFSPNPAMVRVGQTVTWYDADLAAHDVVADGGQFNVGSIPYLATSTPITMNTEGTFSYHSQGNPTMVGTLIVTQ
jgi:aldose sugar dehydrogenase